MTEYDESRGILSEADREYLRGADNYSRQAAHEREKAINLRFKQALSDIVLLSDHKEKLDIHTVELEVWDRAVDGIRKLHPDDKGPEADALRDLAEKLEEQADRIEDES
jgi:hypothetical protein